MKKEKSYPLLLQWMRKQEIEDKMIWKDAAIHQEVFVRDELCHYLLHVPVFVVSTHTSKSIKLPVYRFRMLNGIIVTMRENFHGWVVSIKSPFTVTLSEDLVHGDAGGKGDVTAPYCEGFKEDWVYPYGDKDVRLSTFRVSGDYKLWALMRELNKYPSIEEQKDHNLGESLTATIIEQQMALVDTENMRLYDVFINTYHIVYGLDFCKEHDLDTFFHPQGENLTNEEELKQKIDDFAKRIAMSTEAQNAFHQEMESLWIGRIEDTGLENDED